MSSPPFKQLIPFPGQLYCPSYMSQVSWHVPQCICHGLLSAVLTLQHQSLFEFKHFFSSALCFVHVKPFSGHLYTGLHKYSQFSGQLHCPSYMSKFSGVYPTACAMGFFQQCVPSNTIHFGMSITAMHFLSAM